MNYKVSLINMIIKCAPIKLILWVANKKLKGITEIIDFKVDLETRKIYVHIQLFGENDSLEVWIEDFAIMSSAENYQFKVDYAHSNRPWLANLLAFIVGKPWNIPVPDQYKTKFLLVSDLLAAKPVLQDAI